MLIAQNTINDQAQGTVNVPLVWLEDSRARRPRFTASGNASLVRTQLVQATTSEPEGTFYVARLDLGVSYAPKEIPDKMFQQGRAEVF